MIHDKAVIYPKVERLWEQGLTALQIGHELGLSKNAICGLVYRMRKDGVPLSASKHKVVAKAQQPAGEKVVSMKRPKKPTVKVLPPLPLFAVIEPPPPPPPPSPKVRKGIHFIDLRNNSCRYVISGKRPAEFLFCGDPKTTTAYCAEHAALCYVPFSKTPVRTKRAFNLTNRLNGP